MMKPIVDIEISTHCNARCTFCPREDVPELQYMTARTFEHVLNRLRELPFEPTITLCGTGDCSTHPQLPEIIHQLTLHFSDVMITTNGQLIKKDKATALLNAGLKKIIFSVSEMGEEYDRVYGLSFEKVVRNILEFREISQDRCHIIISPISRQDNDPKVDAIIKFWKSLGFHEFLIMQYTNRAGSLDEEYSSSHPIYPVEIFANDKRMGRCPAPFTSTLIGIDGGYYLCSLDFKKQRKFGSVETDSIQAIYQKKHRYFSDDRAVCTNCSANPFTRLQRNYPGLTPENYIYYTAKHEESKSFMWGVDTLTLTRFPLETHQLIFPVETPPSC